MRMKEAMCMKAQPPRRRDGFRFASSVNGEASRCGLVMDSTVVA